MAGHRSRRRRATALAVAAVLALGVLAAVGAIAVSASATPPDPLQAAKAASARFHSLKQAEKAGYVQASPCVPGHGIHFDNPDLIRDPAIDPLRPEVLLYLPKQNGRLELVGIEYFKADADQNLATDEDRPSLFGQPFFGPMLHPPPTLPVHYELHVWLWLDNPDGVLAPEHPEIDCS